jgi:hypothetical protein
LPTTGTGSDGDDNINGSNVLTLTFATPVTLKGVATLFDPGHSPFGSGNPLTGDFLLSVNGGTFNMVTFATANDEGLNLYGTSFAFEEDSSSTGDVTFYVSALEYQNTPIPAALPLFASGLGVIGLLLRRRKRKTALAG